MRRQHRHQRQLETILAWRDAARYLRGGREEIYYERHQIIDLDKPIRTYRASKGKQHSNMPIREYADWNKGKSFTEKPIQMGKYAPHGKDTKLRTHRKEKKMAIRTKRSRTGTITHTLGKWKTRQLEASLKKLQEAAGNNDMRPIWDLLNKLRMGKTSNDVAIKNKTGANA